jgi:SpoVK/Ycf46/Vps4 family AAA+-type ATPase
MDPVSAIGVAAAAIAFLDFSLETLSRCRELRDSTANALPENLDIERRAKTLRRLAKDLKACCSVSSTAEKRIRELGGKCASLAEELQELLEKIKPNGKSISQALKSVLRNIRDRRTIEKLETTLHSYQNLLGTTILVDLRYLLCSYLSNVLTTLYSISNLMVF